MRVPVPGSRRSALYRGAALILCVTILASGLAALSERAATAAPRDQFITQFLAQYFDTNLINASEVSGSTDSTELFDINNSSKLWYRVEYSSESAQVSVPQQGDRFDWAAMQFGLIAPPIDTPFDCFCLGSTHTVPLTVSFTGPNQMVKFTVDPFDRLAASFDVINLIL